MKDASFDLCTFDFSYLLKLFKHLKYMIIFQMRYFWNFDSFPNWKIDKFPEFYNLEN